MSTEKSGRSLPWFRVDVDLVDHPKVFALAVDLGISDDEALACVVRLWAWTMRYAARGRLAPGARPALERACRVRGPSAELVPALVRTGWLDDLGSDGWEIHDWEEHNGAAVAKAEKDAERKRGARAALGRRADGAGRSVVAGADRRADGAGNGTGRDGTVKKHVEQARLVEVPPTPRPVEVLDDSLTDAEFQVFEHWRQTLRHFKAKATPERKRILTKALKLYSVEDLQRAITGCSRSPHHMGQNERQTVYDDLELILRDAKHIESFMRLVEVAA